MDVRAVCLVFLLVVLLPCKAAIENCTRIEGQPACVCQTTEGVIDLTPLEGNGTAPAFTGVLNSEGVSYSYNPCTTFTEKQCKDSFICQKYPGDPQERTVSEGGEKIVATNEGNFIVTYTPSNDLFANIEVDLFCEEGESASNSNLKVVEDSTLNLLKFNLRSCHACVGGCKETAAQIAGIVGLVLMALVIVAVIVYFIVGAVIMKVHYQATGSDLIPNKRFWMALPILVKDGFMFTISPCYNLAKGRREYSKM